MQPFDALILSGGQGRRLGGVDKASLVLGGETLLARALSAVAGAGRVLIVGRASISLPPGVRVVSEEPAGGGPVAAIAAALPYVDSPVVVILACDMPLMTSSVVEGLVQRLAETIDKPFESGERGEEILLDGVNLVDELGQRQPLAAAYRASALSAALKIIGPPANASMRRLASHLALAELRADPNTSLDCDTWSDVERCQELLWAHNAPAQR